MRNSPLICSVFPLAQYALYGPCMKCCGPYHLYKGPCSLYRGPYSLYRGLCSIYHGPCFVIWAKICSEKFTYASFRPELCPKLLFGILIKKMPRKTKKSRIRETPTLSTDADRRTDTNWKRLRDLCKTITRFRMGSGGYNPDKI